MMGIVSSGEAIKLGHIELPTHFHEAADILEHFSDQYSFRGGALRDHLFSLPHNDIDCVISPKDNQLWNNIKEFADQLPQGHFFHGRALDEVIQSEIQGVKLKSVLSKKHLIFLRLEFNSLAQSTEELDILYLRDDKIRSLADIANLADAPINSLVANKSGELWAHPDFERDFANNECKPMASLDIRDQLRSLYRSAKLRDRHPDISFVPNWKIAPLYKAWQGIDFLTMNMFGHRAVDRLFMQRWRRKQQVVSLDSGNIIFNK